MAGFVSTSEPEVDPGETEVEDGAEETKDRGQEFEPRALLRKSIPAFVAIAVLILVALLAPGLGEVRDKLNEAAPGWVLIAIAFEALSFGSYIVMFAPVFCRGMSWKRSWEIGGSELAMGSLIPASGAAGVALGAWVLHEGGHGQRDRSPAAPSRSC